MLTFERLRNSNMKRTIYEMGHELDTWSVAEWGNATAGECGEACNIAKKMIRFRDGLQLYNNKDIDTLRRELADELADIVIYVDLWAASQGLSLERVIIDKFNRDSTKRELKERL